MGCRNLKKIFDSHFHIIDPKYPLVVNQGFIPSFYTINDYRHELETMGISVVGGAVVSGSFQGFDQSYFVEALNLLGDNFVGVTQIDTNTSDEQIKELDKIGIKNIRFNLYRGFSQTIEEIESLAKRVYDNCGWKTEIYIDANKIDENFLKILLNLPRVSIDHLGLNKCSVDKLKLLAGNNIPIRVTGFGRVEYTRDEISGLIRELYNENPNSLMFGTDLPSTRAKYRFSIEDIKLLEGTLNSEELDNVLYQNAFNWYLK